ncbi:hypothetical protein ACFCYX_28165 [Streptomyces populi]|uniref:hypothetical protein n=1 Tax=Streptomyces populi TaxID=2058924 RepID=UPI0013A7056B|nr:hypothetical protein [Streptomyces populi]
MPTPPPTTAIDVDAWIDKEGRIVRVRQDVHFTSEPGLQSTLTLTGFKSAVPVSVPTTK